MNENLQSKISEELNTHEDFTEDRILHSETIVSNEQDDICFSSFQKETIKSLIRLAPSPSSRETRRLIASIELRSLKETYNTVFLLTKAANKELFHYLGIIVQYPHPEMDLDLLANLKLNAQDKYTTPTIHTYFTLIDKIYSKLNSQQKLKIFYRYIYIFSSRISQEVSLFNLFSKILESDFLEIFIRKQFYVNFPFFKELIINFTSYLGNQLVKIGYEIPIYRKFIYFCAREKEINQGLSHLDWVMSSWQIPVDYSIPKLFYFFDCSPLLDNLALFKFQSNESPLNLIKSDIQNSSFSNEESNPRQNTNQKHYNMDTGNQLCVESNESADMRQSSILPLQSNSYSNYDSVLNKTQCDNAENLITLEENNESQNLSKKQNACFVCNSNGFKDENISEKVEAWLQAKVQMAKSVENFNKSGVLGPEIDVSFIRLIPSVDLKVLGIFLCKEKNYDVFLKFTHSFDFQNMNILEALRYFLSSFILPGESQIINRAIDAFSTVYVIQNFRKNLKTDHSTSLNIHVSNHNNLYTQEELSPFQEKCKKVAYGFIVLNTMLFNPAIDKKPSFEEYLSLAEYDESYYRDDKNPFFSFDVDTLKEFYESIKENEMKIPLCWADSYDKYLLFKKCLVDLEGCFPFQDSSKNTDYICSSCIVICYRHLFINSIDSLLDLSPSIFFQICQILDLKEQFKNYLMFNKKDINRGLESCKLFLEHFIADEAVVSVLFETIEKLEKPKNSVLDFKSLFSRSSTDLKNANQSNSHGTGIDSFNLKFCNSEVCKHNLEIINNLFADKKPFIRQLLNKFILSNSDLIDSFTNFDISVQSELLSQHPSNFNRVSDQAKLKFLVAEFQKGNLSQIYYELYSKITLINQDSFDAFCLLQQKYDDFDRFFIIKEVVDGSEYLIGKSGDQTSPNFSQNPIFFDEGENRNQQSYFNSKASLDPNSSVTDDFTTSDTKKLSERLENLNFKDNDQTPIDLSYLNLENRDPRYRYFKVFEVFSDYLSSLDNLKKLFNLSNSILNLKFAKKIHKDSCPLENEKFNEFNKIVYLLIKCNHFDKSMIEYACCIVNYLSDSLILLINLYEFIYPVFSQISKEFSSILMKILVRRVQLFCESGISCCEKTQDFQLSRRIKKLIQRLVKDEMINMDELKSIVNFIKIRAESFEL